MSRYRLNITKETWPQNLRSWPKKNGKEGLKFLNRVFPDIHKWFIDNNIICSCSSYSGYDEKIKEYTCCFFIFFVKEQDKLLFKMVWG